MMGWHLGSMICAFLSALVKGVLIRDIQGKVSWCILFADDIALIDESSGAGDTMEV